MIEKERMASKDKVIEPLNFESLVGKVKLGHEDASLELAEYLRSRFLKFFSARLAKEAEDLTQSTLYKIFGNLGRFEPKYPKAAFSSQFLGWCFTIGRNALFDEIARKKKEDLLSQLNSWDESERPSATSLDKSEDKRPQPQPELLARMLKDKLAEMLPEHLRKIAEVAIENKSIAEIAAELGYTQGAVRTSLWQARKIIDEELIFPAGYKRAAIFGNNVRKALNIGRINGVKFMHMWYITDEAIRRYQLIKRGSDQKLLDEGYALLSEGVSGAERASLTRFHSNLLRQHRGRNYIRRESLEEFRQKRLKGVRKAKPDSGKYHRLSEFVKTESEQQQLAKAARQGKLGAIKESGMWLVTKEAVEEFREKSGRV